jgi:hypothetical protein
MGSPDAPAVVIVRPCVHEGRWRSEQGATAHDCVRAGSKCGVEGSVSVIQQRSLSLDDAAPRRDCSNCSICCSPTPSSSSQSIHPPFAFAPTTKAFPQPHQTKRATASLLFNRRPLPPTPLRVITFSPLH